MGPGIDALAEIPGLTIPRIIHRIWLDDPLPDEFARYGRGWQELHPGWTVTDWQNSAALPALVNQDLFDRAREICPHDWKRFQSDILRLELMRQFGGVYVDTDMEPLQPLDPLLQSGAYAAWEVQDVFVGQAFLASEPGHLFFDRLIAGLEANVRQHVGQSTTRISGPQYVTDVFTRFPEGVTVLPKRFFYPYLGTEINTADGPWPDAYAVHHWNNRRRGRDGKGHPL